MLTLTLLGTAWFTFLLVYGYSRMYHLGLKSFRSFTGAAYVFNIAAILWFLNLVIGRLP